MIKNKESLKINQINDTEIKPSKIGQYQDSLIAIENQH